MDEKYLAKRFCDLWQECGGANREQVWHDLRQHYQQPHRFYHTLDHLQHCLSELDEAKDLITELRATEMAIWFHDIIYRYGAKDNEILSVAYFRNLVGTTMPGEFVDRVSQFIIATQHVGTALDTGTAFVVDIDLSGFGLPWEGYLADSEALRMEAPGIGDDVYYQGKLRFLDELQRWPSLFQTPFFRQRLETVAQENISRYTADLRNQGFGEQVASRAF